MTEVVLRDEETRIEEGLEEVDGGWRKIADALRRIRDAQAWKQANAEYKTYQDYYNAVWEQRMGVAFGVTRQWIRGLEVYEELSQTVPRGTALPQNPKSAAYLSSIPENERPEFWQKGVLQDKPDGRIRGDEVQQRVNRYKEKKVTAGDVLTDEDWASLPSPKLTPEEAFGKTLGGWKYIVNKLSVDDVLQAQVKLGRTPEHMQWDADAAREVEEWLAEYRNALDAHVRRGIHAVS